MSLSATNQMENQEHPSHSSRSRDTIYIYTHTTTTGFGLGNEKRNGWCIPSPGVYANCLNMSETHYHQHRNATLWGAPKVRLVCVCCIFEQFACIPGNGIHQRFSFFSRPKPGGGVYIYVYRYIYIYTYIVSQAFGPFRGLITHYC